MLRRIGNLLHFVPHPAALSSFQSSGRLTGVYRNFTRLVKFPNANPALKNFSALIFHGLPKNRGEIFGGIATSVNPISYVQFFLAIFGTNFSLASLGFI